MGQQKNAGPVKNPKPALNRCILVVDDNPGVLKLLGTLFEEQGIKVWLAKNVAEAKKRLESDGANIDLVLSDIQMPGESGFDLLKWIKADHSPYRELPVLLTTAQLPEAENRLKGLAMGAVDYVVRPIELNELVLRTIHAITQFQRVRNLELSLQDSEKLAMVGRLMAASSHEIKNLASLVHVCSEQLQRLLGPPATLDTHTAAMLRALTESSSLLTDVAKNVATLFDADHTSVQAVNVTNLAEQVIGLMRCRTKPCRLELVPCPAMWALAHEVRLKQVLINLILNAHDAINELDSIAGGSIKLQLQRDGDRLLLAVIDNGIGFTKAGERKEFAAFSTTKKLRGGQGLGLWLCSRLVEGMEGRLTLSSQGVGLGARAALSLRAVDAPAEDSLATAVQEYLRNFDA